jgi:hypothetical protein
MRGDVIGGFLAGDCPPRKSQFMNEKLPAPCGACDGSGLRDGSECSACRGKGYRLFVNGNQILGNQILGNQIPARQDKPQRRQRQRPSQRRQHRAR